MKKVKIFHGLVNYGTQAGLISRELRKKGYDAISVTGYDPFGRISDKTLKHSGRTVPEKIFNYFFNSIFKLYIFFRYNIFHFYFSQTLTRNQWDLPFYRILGKKVVFHYLGADVQLYKYSLEKYKITNVAYYYKNGPEHDRNVLRRLRRETRYADLQIVCAPYLSEFVKNSIVIPLAIDLSDFTYYPKENITDEIIIAHAPTHRGNKGTEFIINAVEQLKKEGFNIKFLLIENVSHNELKKAYIKCDIFIDQVLIGWYGAAAVEAMAMGRPVICFCREEYYKYIDFGDQIPIINANRDTILDILRETLNKREILPEIGNKSRKFIENIHDVDKITESLISIYRSL